MHTSEKAHRTILRGDLPVIEKWRVVYNTQRPQAALGNRAPAAIAPQMAPLRPPTAPCQPPFAPSPNEVVMSTLSFGVLQKLGLVRIVEAVRGLDCLESRSAVGRSSVWAKSYAEWSMND